MKKMPITLLCGAALMVVTILVYFILFNNIVWQAIHFITLVAVLVAEAITTTYVYFVKQKPRKVAGVILSALAIPASVALSAVYITSFPKGYSSYVGWYFVCVILLNVLAGIIYRFEGVKTKENDALQGAKKNMQNLRNMVKLIMLESSAEEFKADFARIDEKMRFSNDSVIVPQDKEMFDILAELRGNISNTEYDIKESIARIEKLIDERNVLHNYTA